MKRRLLSLAASAIAIGCFGSPTPLAPGLRGSVGLPYHGVLTDGMELPVAGIGFRRFRPLGLRNFGTPTLVTALTRAAASVTKLAPGRTELAVGDLSAKFGGKISGHASHRSGRDVDLLFYATTLDGLPVASPGFIHFGSDGLAQTEDHRYVEFDVRRNWFLVRSLLEDPEAEVLWIFVSRDLEAILIDYAQSIREPVELIARAIRVLHQPRDSANHDDHFHVRIGCSFEERIGGCDPGGPAWHWLKLYPEPQGASPNQELDPYTFD